MKVIKHAGLYTALMIILSSLPALLIVKFYLKIDFSDRLTFIFLFILLGSIIGVVFFYFPANYIYPSFIYEDIKARIHRAKKFSTQGRYDKAKKVLDEGIPYLEKAMEKDKRVRVLIEDLLKEAKEVRKSLGT